MGVALAMVAVGGTMVLAGSGALDGRPPGDRDAVPVVRTASASPTATPSLPAPSRAPIIEGAESVLTREATWTLTVTLPEPLSDRRGSVLRVYRNDRPIDERDLRRGPTARVAGIALRPGENRLSVSIGDGTRSNEVAVTRDDVPPALSIDQPQDGGVVNAPSMTVTGTAEPGATLSVRDLTTERSIEVGAAADGSFQARSPLELGPNEIVVEARDAAGNTTTQTFTVIRGEGKPEARLNLSATSFPLRHLPTPISLRVVVADADGLPVEGASVIFSLSPPGLPTSTYRTETVRGEASWLNVTLPREGAASGDGYATVQVTLANGTVIESVATFTFR